MMAGYLNGSTINVTYKNNPQRYTGGYVTEDFFRIVGVAPILGRDFTADDNKPGAEKTTILGYEIWQRDFSGDPNIVGQAVRINGKAATIIGVMPENFKFPISEQLWVPLYNEFPVKPREDPRPGTRRPQIMGRLKPEVTHRSGERGIHPRWPTASRRIYPKTNGQLTSASVQPLLNTFTGPQLRQTVYAMLGAVFVVLLIACVNVMNMQFGRAALRAKELAIRGALGATRWRIVRQMLTESLLVAAHGRGRRRAHGLLGGRSARSRDVCPAVPAALLGSVHHRWHGPRLHPRHRLARDDGVRVDPGTPERPGQSRGSDEGRRPR